MDADDQAAPAARPAVSLVLHAGAGAAELRTAVRRAAEVLAQVAGDHEILVVGGTAVEQAVRAEIANSDRVRWLACIGGGLGEVLHTAAASARFALVAVAEPGVDLGCLAYLVPLATRFPVVGGYRLDWHGPLYRRFFSWSYNTLSRTLLGTRVRDCGSGLVVLQRSVLADLLPEAADPFAAAEVFARARRLGLAVAEGPVRQHAGTPAGACPRWRDLPGMARAFLALWWSRVLFAGRPAPAASRASALLGLVLMVLAALLLFPELNKPLQDPYEGRQAEIPREMLAHGDFVTPRMVGIPYYEKPPLQYWLTALAYAAFGVRPWAARVVPACAAWLTVLFTYAWGRRALGARPAFLGCLVLCLSMAFVFLGRTVMLDSLLTAAVTACWYAAYHAVSGPRLQRRWWVTSGLLCGLGILTKGPVALVLFGVPVGVYVLVSVDAVRPGWRAWAAYLGVALAVAAPWYTAIALAEPDFVGRFLWRSNVLRFLEPFDHQQPWWYYLPVLFIGTLPWSLLWAWLVYFLVSRSNRIVVFRTAALGFCTLAAGWCLVFFSLSGCKSPLYIAPALAPLALMHGVCLDAILFRRVGRKDLFMDYARQVLPRRATLVVLLLSMGCYAATGVLGWEKWAIVILETVLTLAAFAAWWRYGRLASPRLTWAVCATATLAMVVVAARDLVTGFASRHSVEAIAKAARRWPGGGTSPVVSFGRQWPSAPFYLRRDLVTFYERDACHALIEYLKQEREVFVLVESGEPLDELLQALPPVLEAQVKRPEREGQAALVVVRNHGRSSLARQD
jgi:dolichol-phosphate mannosyltransferase